MSIRNIKNILKKRDLCSLFIKSTHRDFIITQFDAVKYHKHGITVTVKGFSTEPNISYNNISSIITYNHI